MTSRSTEPAAKKPRRVLVEKAADADETLAKCRELRQELSTKISTKNIAAKDLPDSVPSNIQEVEELTTTEVLEGIEAVALGITSQVLSKQGFNFEVPSRASSNQLYIKEWDRIVLGGKRSTRSFMNVKESRKSAVTLRAMSLIHAVLSKRIHITKRDLFYTDVKLFVDQAESDGVLDDIATMIGCTRSNLHVVASDKGLVVGRIQFEEDGDPIDCTRMGVGGKAIPVSYRSFSRYSRMLLLDLNILFPCSKALYRQN
jgi:meiotic recombination protein SPO11